MHQKNNNGRENNARLDSQFFGYVFSLCNGGGNRHLHFFLKGNGNPKADMCYKWWIVYVDLWEIYCRNWSLKWIFMRLTKLENKLIMRV